MPVRSLSSSVIRWPDDKTVREALQEWALETKRNRQEVLEIGYFGSYARGDWGVGSDVDLIVIVAESELPRERRAVEFGTEKLPVPVDLIVYTLREWQILKSSESRFSSVIYREAIWL